MRTEQTCSPTDSFNPVGGRLLEKVKPKQGRSRLLLIVVLVIAMLALAAGFYTWQQMNRRDAAAIVGQWYCTSDGMLYTFVEDGSFSARIGTIDILTGTWQATWRHGYLKLDYEKKSVPFQQVTAYTFENSQKELTLHELDGQLRQMNRQKGD